MSVLDDDGVDDILNDNVLGGDDNEQLFGDDENQEGNEGADDGTAASGGAVKVQPKKRAVLNPRPRLTVDTLRGSRGIHTIEDYFKDVKFKGKGHEKEDLDEVMRRLQHWGHRMYPTYKFDDILGNIERLGKKKILQVHMSRYRLGMIEKVHGELNDAPEDGDEVGGEGAPPDEPFDEFDALLDEQIAISKIAPRTPANNSSKYGNANASIASASSSSFATPSFTRGNAVMSTPYSGIQNLNDTSDLATPLPPSQPSTPNVKQQLTAEQMARIAENRRLAQERLAAKKLAAAAQLQKDND
ncbi:protein TIPIN homolog [Haematobia irritans]|uniref:protein TIPIN homolog n=1 Tax=Haematobia irritans TaxID=7368 RepID=UPI003F4FA2A3